MSGDEFPVTLPQDACVEIEDILFKHSNLGHLVECGLGDKGKRSLQEKLKWFITPIACNYTEG